MAKIVSLFLRNRLNAWCEKEHVFNDSQYGFQDKRSTEDCAFSLYNIIPNMLASKQKLYCAFIDYKSCFDSISINNLWLKLVKSEISCKCLSMLQSLYARVSSCVWLSSEGQLLDYMCFKVGLGLKQGEPLSSILFLLFVNDISDSIDFNNLTENDMNRLSIVLLLFADDLALFTTDKHSLQAQLDSIPLYSTNWGFTINVAKTKICVFKTRKQRHYFE